MPSAYISHNICSKKKRVTSVHRKNVDSSTPSHKERLHTKNAHSSTHSIHGLSIQRIQYISRQCISVFNVFIKNSLQRRLLLTSLFTEEKHSKSHLSGNVEGRYKRAQSSQVWAHYIENGMLKHRKNYGYTSRVFNASVVS